MTQQLVLGVDVGGSHVSCAACDLAAKRYLPETLSVNGLDNRATANEIIGVWAQTIEEAIRKSGFPELAGIGFAMPGPFDYANGIAWFNHDVKKYENLHGLIVPDALRKKMSLPESFPIRFINDAMAFAIAEDWIGKSAGSVRSLAITLGTGFGSAFLNNHLPVVSGNEVPARGYVYHLPFGSGNADDYFSTRGLLARYKSKTGEPLPGVKELALLAPVNQVARNVFDDFGSKLGIFLKSWLEKFDAEVLVIGGNISNAFNLWGPNLKNYLEENGIHVRIEISELKETASMIGSAVLINDDYFKLIKPVLLQI